MLLYRSFTPSLWYYIEVVHLAYVLYRSWTPISLWYYIEVVHLAYDII
jgi:hypothetical protein